MSLAARILNTITSIVNKNMRISRVSHTIFLCICCDVSRCAPMDHIFVSRRYGLTLVIDKVPMTSASQNAGFSLYRCMIRRKILLVTKRLVMHDHAGRAGAVVEAAAPVSS